MTRHDPDLTLCIRAALERDPARIQRLDHHGQFVWVKRKEALSLTRRLQKGDAAAAFEAERRALHTLTDLGAPVPSILDEGPDYLALADSGTPLDVILRDRPVPEAERLIAFEAGARALAGLHRQHLSHGRPSLKDICWDGARITMLDFERFSARRNTDRGHAMDVVLFVFNGLSVGQGQTPEMNRAIAAYRAADPGGIWDKARDWCASMSWLDWATKPLQWRRAGKAREFKAIPLTLATFAAP